MFDDFGVTARDANTRVPCGFGHGANFSFKDRCGQPSLENIGNDQGFGSSSRNRQIIHRTVYREFADRAAGKTQRLDYKTVGRNCNLRATDVHMRGIPQRAWRAAKKQRGEKTFNQLAAGFASGSVRHLDLRVAEADGNGLGINGGRRAQAIELRLVTIAALRCS